jgi:hypothetical protein
MQGEGGDANEVYLFVRGQSGSVAGPLHQIGWSRRYVIFTDQNWPKPWNVIDVDSQRSFTVSESQRTAEKAFAEILIQSPADAWKRAKR